MRIVWIILCITFTTSYAQESVTQETSPASFKWYQINSDHFRILYPKGFDQEAKRVANTLEHIREPAGQSLGITPRKYSVILHNQSSISNGFVTAAPRRSEFFTMPSQNYNFTGTNEWLNLLSTHEYRHMVQFQKSVTGFNKAIYYLFGQLGQAGMSFVAVPQWFWEGDAVVTETAFTNSGRGRIPEFDMVLRANFLEGRDFNYHKQYLRSYKDNIPDHYVLGYHMVSYLREKTGNPEIWSDITKRAWNVPFIPFTFSNAIKKESGLYVRDLYKGMAADLKRKWTLEQDTLTLTPNSKVNVRSNSTYTDYSFPQPLPNGDVLVLKSGIGDISQLVAIDAKGIEKELFVPGPLNDAGMLSAVDGRVVWNEFRVDPRWLVRSYSIIKGFDFEKVKKKPLLSIRKNRSASGKYKGDKQVVIKHSRYAAAALSPDGHKVATVETDVLYQTRLVILDYATGREIRSFENRENRFISMPRWSNDGKHVVFLLHQDSEKIIARANVATGAMDILLDAGAENVGHPIIYNDYLLYNSPVSGIDNIYALNLNTEARYQVTSSRYGAFNPAVSTDGKLLYYNDQSRDGLDVVNALFDPSSWRILPNYPAHEGVYSKTVAEQEGDPQILLDIPDQAYATKRYHRASGMINPHSWGVYTNSNFTTLDFGITSRDVLSTTEINVGYRYDVTERTGLWGAGISYQGLYPIIDADVSFGNRSSSEDYIFNGQTSTVNFEWKETNFEVGIRIPLVTTQTKYATRLSIGGSVGLTKVSDFTNGIDNSGRLVPIDSTRGILFRSYIDNGDLLFNHFTFSYSRFLKRSRRDIFSKWGQTFQASLFATPYQASDYNGNQFASLVTSYFPGILPHHSLWGYGGYQRTLD